MRESKNRQIIKSGRIQQTKLKGTTIYNSNGTQANIDTNVAILNTTNEKYRIRIKTVDNITKYGVIDDEGQQIIEEKYNYLEYLYDDYFMVSNEKSKLGIIDKKENEKLQVKYDSIQKIQNTDLIQATITESKVTEIFNKKLQSICQMENAKIEKQGEYIKIYNNEETRYFDKDGKEVKNTQVYANNKLFAQEKDGKWGFVDINGQKVVDYIYDKVTEFNNYGFAGIQKDGKWGSIDGQGKVVYREKNIEEFEKGYLGNFELQENGTYIVKEDAEFYKVDNRVRKVWEVTIYYDNYNKYNYPKKFIYFVDATTGEIIGGDRFYNSKSRIQTLINDPNNVIEK